MTDLTPSPRCTVCGSDDLDANTWEASCYACDMTPLDLQARREMLGLSQADLARLLDVAQPTISAWENGSRTPRDPITVLMQLQQLADAQEELVVQLVDLIEGKSAKLHQPAVELVTYRQDVDYWVADPAARKARIPASMHRVAAAHAAAEVEAEHGISVTLVERP